MKALKLNLATLVASGLALGLATPSLAISISPTTDATTLVNSIIGTGINVVGAASYTGTATQSGTFTGASGAGLSFTSGVVMTTGNVADVPGPNSNGPESVAGGGTADDDISTSLGTAGDASLTLLAGNPTHDAAVLEFDFMFGDGSTGGDLFFNFAFASEEYLDYVGSEFNDVFGFYVDGVNIALVPGTADPVTVNTINPFINPTYYNNNVSNTNGYAVEGYDMSFDGLTDTMTAQALGLSAGVHTMKFAIADTMDGLLDAGVFIQGDTFSNTPTDPGNHMPEPGAATLFGLGILVLRGASQRLRS